MSAQQPQQIEQLQATLSKMELTLLAIADAVVWVAAEEHVQWCNPSFERLVNRPKTEIIGSRFSDLLPLWQGENPVALELYPNTRIHQGDFTPTEYEFRQADCSLVLHIAGSLADITSEKSAILIIQDITQQKEKSLEITKRKLAEEALRRSNAIQQAQQEAAVDGILIIDENRKIISYNQRFADLWQIPATVIQSEDNWQLLPAVVHQLENPAEFLAKVEYLYQHPEEISREQISLKGGRVLDCYSAPVSSSSENYFGRIWYCRDITERRLTEEALQASESRLNTILNSALAAIYRFRAYKNHEWYFEYCSPGSLQLWGFTPEELIADQNLLTSRIIPEDLENALPKIFDAIFEERAFDLEYRYLHPDGNLRWISLKLISARDETTNTWLATVISTDITDKKLAEEALKASEARLNKILNSALAAIYLIRAYANREWFFEYCSAGCLEMWGYTPEELMADKNLALSRVAPEDSEIAVNKAFEAIFLDQPCEVEYRYLHPDGSLRWFSMNLTSVRDEAADFWLATMISTDITERKRAEEIQQRRAQTENILSSISRYLLDQDLDTAINFTLEAIAKFIHAERSCIYTYSENQQECYLLYEWCAEGIEPMADISRSIAIEQFPGIHQQMFQGKAVQFISEEEVFQNSTEVNILTASAIKSVMLVPMMHAGTVVGVLTFHTVSYLKTWSQEDINFLKLVGELIAMGRARHQAEAALMLAKEAAEAANRAKSMFLANMSHELRTPLNAILGFAQLMERDRTLNPKQRDSLATINRSGEHLLNLIDDVLEMSKIEAGRVVFHPETLDLLALLRIIQEMFLVRTQAKQLCLQFEIASDVPQYINTDPGKLRQVLINLLGNAVKFTTHGGITLRVKSGTRNWGLKSGNQDQNTQSLIFEIEDTGCGIAPEEMPNLFQPFVQTSSGIHLKSGTGLGLTISSEFVKLMGGEIHAQSIFGQGSTFSFDIAVNVCASSPATSQLHSRRIVKLAAHHPTMRILVVDDIAENRNLIAQILSSTGFEVQVAVNGEEAISQWQAWQPHLIFMDMRMPVIDGYEATRIIRARETQLQQHSIPHAPTIIIALTASAFDEQKATIIAAGCDDLVRKPFKERIIFEKIAEYIKVKYICVEEANTDTQQQGLPMNQGKSDTIISIDLAKIMPAEWLIQLHQAALEVDGDRILQLTSEIPANYADIANELIRLVRRFSFDEILELAAPKTNR